MLRDTLAKPDQAQVARRVAPALGKAPATARVLVERYGDGQEPRKPAEALLALLRRLRLADYDWERVDPADRFDVAWVLWQSADPPAEHKAFLQGFLSWLDAPERRHQVARLAIVWSAAFDPSLESVRIAGEWLAAHIAWLPDPWPRLAEEFDIFSLDAAPRSLANAFLDGNETEAQFFAGLHLPALAVKGGLAFEILAAAAETVAGCAMQAPHLVARVCDLAVHGGAFRPDTAPPRRGATLSGALAAALLSPWQTEAPPKNVQTGIVGFLLRHYGDARLTTARWLQVPQAALAVMRRWLTEETVACYFRLAGEAKTANRERLAEREAFWMARLADIDDAWLLAGPQGRSAFGGRLAHGRLGGCRPDQSALLLRIRGLTILEASHAEAETVWFARNGFAPALFRPAADIYWLGSLNRCADYSSAFNHKNNDSWQARLDMFLEQRSMN